MRSSINFSLPRWSRPMWISVFSIISPLSCRIKRKTPWAAGCCGPKFRFIVFIVFVLAVLLVVMGFQFWKILLFRIYLFSTFNFFLEKTFVLFFLTILAYSLCLCVLFFVLFFFKDARFSTLANFKSLNSFFFFKFLISCIFLALAGIPPFFSFFLKSFFFIFFLKKGTVFVLVFLVLNLLSMYFYLQSTRLLVNSAKKSAGLIFFSKVVHKFEFFFFLEFSFLLLFLGFFFLVHFWVLLLSLFL
jgi:hypothetical protein